MTILRKKLIEVALPLEKINIASAREKSIRHGHPSTLHLWWARRPLAAARAVIFAQMVDDPSEYTEELRRDPVKYAHAQQTLAEQQAAWEIRQRAFEAVPVPGERAVLDPGQAPTLEECLADNERQRLFRLIEQLVLWENTTNEPLLQQARDEIWKSWRRTCAENKDHPRAAELFDPDKLPAFHDPFAGGGAIPLEAQRLGLESYASDLNPVAVLINKAMIEIPPKFAGRPPVNPAAREGQMALGQQWHGAQGLADDVRYYGKWMRDEAEKRIGHLYPKIEITAAMVKERPDLKAYLGQKLTVIAWLWARTVKSPNPAFAHVDVPLASTFMLSTKPGKESYVQPVIDGDSYRFTVRVGKPKDAETAKNGTKLARGANFRCLMSETPIGANYIRSEAQAGRMSARLMAIVAEGDRGRVYLAPTTEHEAIAHRAEPNWQPDVAMPDNPRWFSPPLYGLKTFGELFTPRQLVALNTFSDLVGEARERVRRDALGVSSPPGPLSTAGGEGGSIVHNPAVTPPPGPFSPAGGEGEREGVQEGEQEREREGGRSIVRNPAVTPEKAQLAKDLRQRATDAEQAAWEALRDRRCLGLKFRRQQVIRGFIVDFYCAEHRLVIEIDGPIHERQRDEDEQRSQVLALDDIRVIRLRNEDATPERLTATIARAIASPSLTPAPSPFSTHGEGGQGDEDLPLDAGGTGATAYAEAVGVYLAFAQSKACNRNTSLCLWERPMDRLVATFGRQALPMVWDYAETNPIAGAGGDIYGTIISVAEVLDKQFGHSAHGKVWQDNAVTQEQANRKIVSTDPPYYDNIGYADLSDFFYIWLRRSLQSIFPALFTTLAVPKAEELVATPYRHGGKQLAEKFFLNGMTKAMQRLAEQSHVAFPVTIYYAFKQSESDDSNGSASTGWETFLDAVIRAGFAVSGTWPMRTEQPKGLRAFEQNSLASSIILVCRPRPADAPTVTRRDFIAALKAELPLALANMQRGNIAPVDLAQASIGPGMAAYTRYGKVIDASGKVLSVREALTEINKTLDEVLKEQEGDFDADTRWALAWFEQYGFAEGEYGVAETLSKAKNTSVGGMVSAGLVASGAGKVRLLRPDELPAQWDPTADTRLTVWEIVHHLVRVLEQGELSAATLLTTLGARADIARELAYRLYAICERKKRAAEALAYNGLVQSWPEMLRLAQEQPSGMAVQQGMGL